jgi:outer membrane autotransporter protein
VRVSSDAIAGASGAAARGNINYSGGLGSATVDDYRIDLYGQQRFEALTIDVILSAGLARYDQSRAITIPGLTRIARSEFNRHELGAMLRVARTFPIAESSTTSWSVRPSAGLAASMSRQDGYTESGAGALDLSVDGLKNSTLSGMLGIDLRGRIESSGVQWLPYSGVYANRRLTYGDSSITQTLSSLGTFSVPAYLEPLTTYVLRIGVDVRFNKTSSAYLELSDSHGQGTSGQAAMAGARIHW